MKVNTRAARKYAGALFQVATQRNLLDRAHASLTAMAQVIEAHPDLLTLMTHPRIALANKQELASRLFGGVVDELLLDFMHLVIDKRRFALLEAIAKEFNQFLEEHRRTMSAEATTAVGMSAEQQERLRQRLSALTGYQVRLTARVDPQVVGGLTVRMKGQLLDGSVATQLRRIREQLQQARVATTQ